MGTYSVNQVRQFHYLKGAEKESKTLLKAAGDWLFSKVNDDKSFCIQYVGAEDNKMRTDIVDIDKVLRCRKVSGLDASQVNFAKAAMVKLSENAITEEGNVLIGENYIMTIVINQAFSKGDDDTYIKTIPVHGTVNMTESDFYNALAKQCVLSFVRDTNDWFKFYIGKEGALTEVNKENYKTVKVAGADSIVIIEAPQKFIVGLSKEEDVKFTVTTGTVENQEEEIIWGVVTTSESVKDGENDDDVDALEALKDTTGDGSKERWASYNGKRIADLEWFAMGERGDQYRMVGYPNYVPTTYLCEKGTNDYGAYDIIEIHYAYVGPGVSCQKSERDMTLVFPIEKGEVEAGADLGADAAALVAKIEAALGYEIPTTSK